MPLSPFIMTLTYEHMKEDSQGTFAVQNRYERYGERTRKRTGHELRIALKTVVFQPPCNERPCFYVGGDSLELLSIL